MEVALKSNQHPINKRNCPALCSSYLNTNYQLTFTLALGISPLCEACPAQLFDPSSAPGSICWPYVKK